MIPRIYLEFNSKFIIYRFTKDGLTIEIFGDDRFFCLDVVEKISSIPPFFDLYRIFTENKN